ncbi:MAG: aldo/keto reductase [Alphaproteobacteria bacterium]|nr:aldo/keto reductase [Alphaproteobacteria bacterium]
MLEKVGLGTVQFGQPYGISNTHGQVSPGEAAAILAKARQAGIPLLDTAANYGEAEAVLAKLDTAAFRIVSKTIGLKHGLDQVIARARQSAATLKADTLLVHAAADLLGPDGDGLWSALRRLRDDGVIRKIGISVYVVDDPAALAARFRPDVMQLPFSLLDQRLLANGALTRLTELGVEIHARSLFLQGLLFLNDLPEKLRHAGPHLDGIRARLRDADATPLAAALGFVLSRPEIAFGLVGVTSASELDEIIGAARAPLPDLDWAQFALNDEVILTPSLW